MLEFPHVPDKDKMPPDLLARALKEAEGYPTREKPYWVQVMGIPGAGKTLFVESLANALSFRKPYALAANDVFLVQIPEYQQMSDHARAFELYDGTARAIAFTIFEKLIAQKADVVYEHSTVYPAVRDLQYYVKQQGYTLILVRITVPIDVAKERAHLREQVTGRHIPESVIDERVGIVEERWAELSPIADHTVLFDNDGSLPAEQVFEKPIADTTAFIRGLPA